MPIPIISGHVEGELLTWSRLAYFSLVLSLLAVGTESAALLLPYQTFDNTSEVTTFYLDGCAGASGAACDPSLPQKLVQAAIGLDCTLSFALLILSAQAFNEFWNEAPASTGWARVFFRPLGCVMGLARMAVLFATLGLKESSLKAFAAWSTKGDGWVCLIVAIIAACLQMVPLALLASDDVYVSANVRAAAAVELSKAISNSPLRDTMSELATSRSSSRDKSGFETGLGRSPFVGAAQQYSRNKLSSPRAALESTYNPQIALDQYRAGNRVSVGGMGSVGSPRPLTYMRAGGIA